MLAVICFFGLVDFRFMGFFLHVGIVMMTMTVRHQYCTETLHAYGINMEGNQS